MAAFAETRIVLEANAAPPRKALHLPRELASLTGSVSHKYVRAKKTATHGLSTPSIRKRYLELDESLA
jgi:hypothetical protein